MSASQNHEIKKEPIDNDIEVLGNITYSNQNSNNKMYSASVPVKSEFNNNQTESNKDEKIKQLEQMQEMLFEKIRIKTNENEILKQNETNLIAKNNELHGIIEINTNNQINLSNEITSLKDKLFKAQKIIELKTTEINEMNQVSKSIN
jgi:hypothetical protein